MRRPHTARLQRNALSAALSVLIAAALVFTMLVAGDVTPVVAQGDLLTQLETGLSDAGVTVTEPKYIADSVNVFSGLPCEEWTFGVSYKGVGGIVQIFGMQRPEQAQKDTDAYFNTLSSAFRVSVNGASAGASKATATQGNIAYSATYVWWPRDRYFVYSYLVQSTNTDVLVEIDEVIDEVLSGASGSGGAGDAASESVEPPVEPGLTARAVPASFSEIGDTVSVRVTLTGPDVAGKSVSLMGHGLELSAVTDSGGVASFAVTHDDETLSEYRFAVTSEGMTSEIVVPVLALDIHPEIEPASGEPYAGVAADGRSVLTLEIDTGSAAGGTLRVAEPDLGTLGGSALGSDGAIALSGGKATIEYTPPAYVVGDRMADRVPLAVSSGATMGSARGAQTVYINGGSPWAATVPITFTHTDADGRETEVAIDVLVTRAPVLLIHGFGGSKATWAALQQYLGERRFDAIVNEYYLGDQSVQAQARGLGTDISREIGRYADLGVKLARVDLIGHSMGGLIARDYTYGLPPHPSDVRKIIMVGTPNHGANYVDKILGNAMAEVTSKHPLASQQLYSGSAFLAQLNEGEVAGRHLSPDVQYGNIYGVRSDYVVTGSSAYLNGVSRHIITGVTHSSDIALPGIPITNSDAINGWIVEWLGSDIPRAPLSSTRAQIVTGSGDVFISGIETFGETLLDVETYPKDLQPWEHVVTAADSRARIRLSVAGLAWGSIDLAPDTIIALGNLTPDSVTVRIRQGSARFRSLKRNGGGHFEVVVGESAPGEWTTFHPDAKVVGLDTDFVVSADGAGQVEALVLDGQAVVDDGSAELVSEPTVIDSGQVAAVGTDADYVSEIATNDWWSDGFYRSSFIEVLQEWWAIVRSLFAPAADAIPAATATQ